MAPTPAKFDYLVIGGGSGGLATARKAASFGKTVAIIESTPRFGGTSTLTVFTLGDAYLTD